MARQNFSIEKGLSIFTENGTEQVDLLIGDGAPSADAPLGSVYKDYTNGNVYHKAASGAGADKWLRFANTNDLKDLSFRSERVIAATGQALAAGTIDLVANPFSDDDAPTLVAADFIVGDYIISGVGGTVKLFKVTAVSGDTITIAEETENVLAANDNFIVKYYLPDSPDAQEKEALVHYNGAAIIKIADMNWDVADGIKLPSGYTAGNGSITSADSVNSAIQKLDGNQQDLQTLSGVAQGSTNLGSFTGNIIPDDQNNKEALQALETAVESGIQKSLDNVTTEVSLDELLVDNFQSALYQISVSLVSDESKREVILFECLHDGTPSSDAAKVDDTSFAKLKLNGGTPFTVKADLSGSGASQVMRVRLSASSAIKVRSVRLSSVAA
jgi:hypothetical protein